MTCYEKFEPLGEIIIEPLREILHLKEFFFLSFMHPLIIIIFSFLSFLKTTRVLHEFQARITCWEIKAIIEFLPITH